jgi:hypothetical protein
MLPEVLFRCRFYLLLQEAGVDLRHPKNIGIHLPGRGEINGMDLQPVPGRIPREPMVYAEKHRGPDP